MQQGQVYWITGLSGSGKTTISKLLVAQIRAKKANVILLDGDEMREMLGVNGAFTYEERKKLAFTYSRLCRLLSEQGQIVVCATISMFEEVRSWNRQNLINYKEIYLKCLKSTLIERDEKGIYQKLENNQLSNVAGFDVSVEEPRNPDLVLNNDGALSPQQLVEAILHI